MVALMKKLKLMALNEDVGNEELFSTLERRGMHDLRAAKATKFPTQERWERGTSQSLLFLILFYIQSL
jgi:hypothetical protein